MTDIDKPLPNDIPNVTLTLRLIMSGKEVGGIIGKGGEIINNIREESGAKIHISDGSVPERIVTVTGSTDAILKSFNLIGKKFEEDGPEKSNGESSGKSSSASSSSSSQKCGGVSLKLVVPASQCGSLIGKGGSKIKEIREVTGASVQVASELLPNSTERTVTIGGARTAITQCIYQICCVMLESPPKGTTIPYTPKAGMLSGMGARNMRGGHAGSPDNPLASLLNLGGGASTLAAIASLAGSQIRDNRRDNRDREDRGGGGGGSSGSSSSSSTSFEIFVPNDMIGCIIGKGGSKIAEIRQISGAMIRISKSDDNSERESAERQITITGNADSVALAKSLINMSLDLHKSKMEEGGNSGSSSNERGERSDRGGGVNDRSSDRGGSRERYSSNTNNLGLAAQLLAKPEALTTALTTLASLSSLGNLGGGLLAGLTGSGGSGSVTGVHRRSGGNYGGSRSSRNNDDNDRRDSKRSKFAPY
eukprot:13770.XXX_15006_16572_1 [CDS] Oithona nana genome sequencing.